MPPVTLHPLTRAGLLALAAAQLVVLSARGSVDDALLIGVALSALLAIETWSPWLVSANRSAGTIVVSALILCNFVAALWRLDPPYPMRPLIVAILTGYAVATLQGLLAPSRRRGSLAVPVALGGVFLAVDLRAPDPTVVEGRIRWRGVTAPATGPLWRLAPDRPISSEYPSDSGRYFEDTTAFQASWLLSVHDTGSAATVRFPREWPAALRVDIQRASRREWFGIQLNQSPLHLDARERYRVTLEARADAPRTMSIAVSQGHPPWQGLGFSVVESLDRNWRSIVHEFELPVGDSVARVHIDLGLDTPSVEFRRLALRRVRDGLLLQSMSPRIAAVTYRINHAGCRGSDVPATRSLDGVRVLAVGGSRVFGVGVHEADAAPAVLADRLRADTSDGQVRPVEVLNCGAPGFVLAEAPAVLRELLATYQPQVVLLDLGLPSDSALIAQSQLDARAWRARLHQLFRITDPLARRRETTLWSAEAVARAVRSADDIARRANARLLVVIPPYLEVDAPSSWLKELLARVRADGVAVIDVRDNTPGRLPDSLYVHPLFDAHANAAVHRQTGEAMARALHAVLQPLRTSNTTPP